MTSHKSRLVIKGVNSKGEVFRPSDWAQRLSAAGAQFGEDNRLQFSPFLRPNLNNGVVCVVVEPELEETNPAVFKHVISFAEANDLITQYDDVA